MRIFAGSKGLRKHCGPTVVLIGNVASCETLRKEIRSPERRLVACNGNPTVSVSAKAEVVVRSRLGPVVIDVREMPGKEVLVAMVIVVFISTFR